MPRIQPFGAKSAGGFTVTNIRFTNNLFSNVHYPCVGSAGVWFTRGAPTDGWNRSGNILLETGQNLDAKNPVVGGSGVVELTSAPASPRRARGVASSSRPLIPGLFAHAAQARSVGR
jgi:hypothetical protein